MKARLLQGKWSNLQKAMLPGYLVMQGKGNTLLCVCERESENRVSKMEGRRERERGVGWGEDHISENTNPFHPKIAKPIQEVHFNMPTKEGSLELSNLNIKPLKMFTFVYVHLPLLV